MPIYDADPNAKSAATVEVPPWERGHRTLDQLADEMRGRAHDIEQQQARLAGELDAVQSVLQRISPAPPIAPASVGTSFYGGNTAKNPIPSRGY